MMINKKIDKHIKENIIPQYKLNDKGHDIHHIQSVLSYAMEISKEYPEVNTELVKLAVIYHDVGCHIDRKNHHVVSANIILNDEILNKYLTEEQISELYTAVIEHRSKCECTTTLSKILSDADKADACRLDRMIYRAWYYGRYYFPETKEEDLILRCHKTQNKRYGKNAYFQFNLPETIRIIKKDLEFSRKCLDNYKELFLPYTYKLINQGVLK